MSSRYAQWGKFISLCIVTLCIVTASSVSKAALIEAYLYEISIAGSFGTAIDPIHSNLPDSTYPFPTMRGGSFEGVFIYDSWAAYGASSFPYVSVNVDIRDNTGTIVHTIATSPNEFLVFPPLLQLTFGPSDGILNSIEDLRLQFNGAFTLAPPSLPPGMSNVVPPPPSEIVSGVFDFGFLETDLGLSSFWDLPVSTVSLLHTGTTSYIREVPEPGSGVLLFLSVLGMFAAGLYQQHLMKERGRATFLLPF